MTEPKVTARAAPLAVRHFEDVWGTVVGIDVRDQAVLGVSEQVIRAAIAEVVTWLHQVDRIFSTYRADSIVNAYRANADIITGSDEFKSGDIDIFTRVLSLCENAREKTNGVFNPWAVPGGFDPSGIVKGWAVQEAAALLDARGLKFFLIDGSGDIVCRGGEDVGVPWHIGIQHPDNRLAVMKQTRISSGATATSGTYVLGSHIVNVLRSEEGLAARAATVVGPDAVWCEVWATVAVVRGSAALHDIAALGSQWSALVVEGERVSVIGDAFN